MNMIPLRTALLCTGLSLIVPIGLCMSFMPSNGSNDMRITFDYQRDMQEVAVAMQRSGLCVEGYNLTLGREANPVYRLQLCQGGEVDCPASPGRAVGLCLTREALGRYVSPSTLGDAEGANSNIALVPEE